MQLLPLLLVGLFLSIPALAATPDERETLLQAFVDEMVRDQNFERDSLTTLLHQARFRSDIIDTMERPAEAKPWYQYRPLFVNRNRAWRGVQFWNANAEALAQATWKYGVAPEIIVAILGVETRYGEVTGKYRLLDALTTLAFGYPKRAEFFRSQLKELLLLVREERLDLADSYGSYAGAMGLPQFMPGSYRNYAVDFDGDGRRDLWNSNADAIGSVANYFKQHGWRAGETVTRRATVIDTPPQAWIDAGMKPSLSVAQLTQQRIVTQPVLAPETQVSLIRLQGETEDEYWLGLNNFYTITRYNHSNLYAMAVYQLSREILALRNATPDNATP